MSFNYDPNVVRRGFDAKVEITLQQWEFKESYIVEVGGNIGGFDIMDTAIGTLEDRLCEEADADAANRPKDEEGNAVPQVILKSPEDTLLIECDHDDVFDWLKAMVVKVEIVDFGPES